MRKHHNRLYFGKYSHKATFRLPGLNILYPTSDYYISRAIRYKDQSSDIVRFAKYLMEHRSQMKFRLQNRSCIFYSSKKIILESISKFWDFWVDITSTDPKLSISTNDVVVCKRLPLGKYNYQVHTKRKMYTRLSDAQRRLLRSYLTQNDDNATVTNKNLKAYLSLNGFYSADVNSYFYVKDENALTPIYMISKDIVDRVIKFVKV